MRPLISRHLVWALALFFVFAVAAGRAGAQEYTADVLYQIGAPDGDTAPEATYVDTDGQAIGYAMNDGNQHAVYWNSDGVAVDLNPPGFTSSFCGSSDPGDAAGISGDQEVGSGVTAGGATHALLWTGTAASFVDLNPPEASYSEANANFGSFQGGLAVDNSDSYAADWNGSASLNTDLDTLGQVLAMDGQNQVGYGGIPFGNAVNAAEWSGTAGSVTFLTTPQRKTSYAFGVSGTQVVGVIGPPGGLLPSEPVLWTGGSVIDLSVAGYAPHGDAYATNGVSQVGVQGTDSGEADAMLWNGSATNYVDLGELIPSSYGATGSTGESIDANGDVYGSFNTSSGAQYAIEWVATVPEPSCAAMLVGAASLLIGRRRRSHVH
ncbi:MAG: hypothetical protein ABSF29_15865 [Tepidisphaeraceae bacterium]|jgi:hypothetical protein